MFDSIAITHKSAPVVSITQSDDTVCQYQPVQLQALTNPPSSIYQYSWTPTIGLNNPNIANPIATPSQSTLYVVAVSTPNNCGGVVYDSVYVHVRNGDISSMESTAENVVLCMGAGSISVTPKNIVNLTNI